VTASAQGIDFSSYQPELVTADLSGEAFAFTRVSNWSGTFMGTDHTFMNNWFVMREARLHRGAYWYLSTGEGYPSVTRQADYFVTAVKNGGVLPGDMLVCDSEVVTATVNSDTHMFCKRVQQLMGAEYPVLVYTNHNVGQHLVSCTKWPLWFAWPNNTAPPESLTLPWKSWKFWQWGTKPAGGLGTVDADAYNGTVADLQAWLNTYLSKGIPEV
jgi:GH25 family lysozyme M1 (1,4-beta-N-acetylmuramidase)